MCSPVEGPRRTETSHFFIKSLELKCHVHIFYYLCNYIPTHGYIFIRYYAFYIYVGIYVCICIAYLCVYTYTHINRLLPNLCTCCHLLKHHNDLKFVYYCIFPLFS